MVSCTLPRRRLNVPQHEAAKADVLYDDLCTAQGGTGRLNFPLFGELINAAAASRDAEEDTPPPFGRQAQLRTLLNLRQHHADAGARLYTLSRRSSNASIRAPTASTLAKTASVPTLERTQSGGLPVVVSERAEAEHLGLTLEPLPRQRVPTRCVLRARNKGSHANLTEAVATSAMFIPESERLTRDQWDAGADARRKRDIAAARAERRAANYGRIMDMVQQRQEKEERVAAGNVVRRSGQALWLLERSVGSVA